MAGIFFESKGSPRREVLDFLAFRKQIVKIEKYIEYLNEILNYGNEEDRINIISLLNNYSINCNSDKLKILYNTVKKLSI